MKSSVQQALERTAAQIATHAEAVAAEINDWQTIKSALTRRIEVQLTPIQQQKLEQYQYVYNQLVSGKYTEMDVLEMLQGGMYDMNFQQALRTLRDAKELFSATLNVSKLFEIRLQLERNLVMLNKCDKARDPKAYAQIEKNRVKLLSMLPEEGTTVADDFVPRQNLVMYDPTLLGVTPADVQDLLELKKELEKKYGGKITFAGKDFEDAEIVDNEPDPTTL